MRSHGLIMVIPVETLGEPNIQNYYAWCSGKNRHCFGKRIVINGRDETHFRENHMTFHVLLISLKATFRIPLQRRRAFLSEQSYKRLDQLFDSRFGFAIELFSSRQLRAIVINICHEPAWSSLLSQTSTDVDVAIGLHVHFRWLRTRVCSEVITRMSTEAEASPTPAPSPPILKLSNDILVEIFTMVMEEEQSMCEEDDEKGKLDPKVAPSVRTITADRIGA